MNSSILRLLFLETAEATETGPIDPWAEGVPDHVVCRSCAWPVPEGMPLPDFDAIVLVGGNDYELLGVRERFADEAIVSMQGPQCDADTRLRAIRLGADEVFSCGRQGLYECLRVAVERRRRERAENSKRKVEQQTQKMESVARVSAGIAHEVRHAAQIVLGNCSILERACAGQYPDVTTDIREANEKTLKLFDRLLAFAVAEPSKGTLVDLSSLLNKQLPLYQAVNLGRAELLFEGLPIQPFIIDPAVVEHVTMNLVVNAFDSLDRGGTVSVEWGPLRRVTSYLTRHGELKPGLYAHLRVSDTGKGIPERLLDRVFEPSFVTHKEHAGMGLATVQSLLRTVGGCATVVSSEGLGTCAHAFFPIGPGERCALPTRPRSKKICLLLSRPTSQRLALRTEVESYGWRVLEARDRNEVGLLTKATPVDLALCEAELLLGHSAELRRTLLPAQVVVTSLFPQHWLRRRGMLPPQWEYLATPWDGEELGRLLAC